MFVQWNLKLDDRVQNQCFLKCLRLEEKQFVIRPMCIVK